MLGSDEAGISSTTHLNQNLPWTAHVSGLRLYIEIEKLYRLTLSLWSEQVRASERNDLASQKGDIHIRKLNLCVQMRSGPSTRNQVPPAHPAPSQFTILCGHVSLGVRFRNSGEGCRTDTIRSWIHSVWCGSTKPAFQFRTVSFIWRDPQVPEILNAKSTDHQLWWRSEYYGLKSWSFRTASAGFFIDL